MEIHHIHQSDTHTRTLSLLRMIIQTPQQMELHLVHQSGTHTQTHTLSLSRSLILKIIQTPRQLKIHHVNQSCRHSYTPFNTHDNTDSTADGNKSSSSVRYLHTYTLSLLPKKTQTPRQMKIHHVN